MTDDKRNGAMFDLDAYDEETSTELVIRDPATGNATPAVFTIAGPEHSARREIKKAEQRRLQRGLERYGRIVTRDPDEMEEDETDMLVASTLGWRGVMRNGIELPYSASEARKLYTDPKRAWLREQVKKALDERERFIRRSAES